MARPVSIVHSYPKGRRPRRRRWLRRAVLLITGLMLSALVLAGGLVTYLMVTEAGRETVARRLERELTRMLPGSVSIGALERLALGSATLRDLRFFEPGGGLVLRVLQAEIDFDPRDLARGTIHFERARIEGGQLIVAVQPDGRTGIEAAFDAKGPGQGEPARIALRAIHVQDLLLVLRPAPDQTFRMREVQGFVAIEQQPGMPGVQVTLDRIQGRLEEPEVLGERIDILRADGWVHGGAKQILALDVAAELDQDRFDAALAYYPRAKEPVVLELDPKEGLETELAALGAELQSWVSKKVDVQRK